MPVTTWRRPALAPVYALVTTFVLVMALGLVTGAAAAAATLRIRTDDPLALGELAGSVIEVRDPTGPLVVMGVLSPQGTYELPDKAQGRMVCLLLPARWQVTQPVPTGQCINAPLTPDFPVSVAKYARVTVEFTGLPPDQAAPRHALTKVVVRNGSIVESGPPDASGHYQPRTSLGGVTVCVTPPVGGGAEQCQNSSDPHKDITFTLEGQ